MFDIAKHLEELKASPYEDVEIRAPHTGVLTFQSVEEGATVRGPSGSWNEKPGDALAVIEREGNKKTVRAPRKGMVSNVAADLDGLFVEAGERLLTLRHHLSKDEALDVILKKALRLFPAPERAKYYFVPDIEAKVKASGCSSVTVREGMELFIMSRMKRETIVPYSGPEGVIYSVYFQHNEPVDASEPLIGVCPPEQLPFIQEAVLRVRNEWEEPA